MRGGCAIGRCAIGTPGFGAAGLANEAETTGDAGFAGVVGGAIAMGADTVSCGFTGAAGAGTENVGRSPTMGTTNLGAGAGGWAAGEAGLAIVGADGATAGLASAGGFTAMGRGGALFRPRL